MEWGQCCARVYTRRIDGGQRITVAAGSGDSDNRSVRPASAFSGRRRTGGNGRPDDARAEEIRAGGAPCRFRRLPADRRRFRAPACTSTFEPTVPIGRLVLNSAPHRACSRPPARSCSIVSHEDMEPLCPSTRLAAHGSRCMRASWNGRVSIAELNAKSAGEADAVILCRRIP